MDTERTTRQLTMLGVIGSDVEVLATKTSFTKNVRDGRVFLEKGMRDFPIETLVSMLSINEIEIYMVALDLPERLMELLEYDDELDDED